MPRIPKAYYYKERNWTLRELEQISPVGRRTIQKRLESGWSLKRAIEEAKYNHETFEIASAEEAYRGCTDEQLTMLAEFEHRCQTAKWE
jgi:hypothetical protein